MPPPEVPRPLKILQDMNRHYGDLWRFCDVLRSREVRQHAKVPWPSYCFVTFSGMNIYLHLKNPQITDAEVAGPTIPTLGAIAAWRATQGIYDFDPTIFEELWFTPITGNIPTQLLLHLPEWCCYVRCNKPIYLEQARWGEHAASDWIVYGFWVHLEYDDPSGETEIRFLIDCFVDNKGVLIPQGLPLGDWTFEEAVHRSVQLSINRQRSLGKTPVELQNLKVFREYMAELNAPLLSLTLYLCTVAAELRSGNLTRPRRPVPVKTKKGPRLFPPSTPQIWTVAERLGAALRLGQARAAQPGVPGAPEEHAHRSGPRPHIRRAHWHTYRVGKGRGDVRVYWLHPILVAASDPAALVPTSRPVN